MVILASRKTKLSPEEASHAQLSAMVEEQYQNFDVVWAKLGSYPWWPGVLFYSWDAVNASGCELKQVQSQLVIPPPTVQVLPDGKQRMVYSVLVMFLDRFDCNVFELTPKFVCPFAINYHKLNIKPKKNAAGFRIAHDRAIRLLHMNTHMTVEDLDAIAPIRVEEELTEAHHQVVGRTASGKRQKRSHPNHAVAKNNVDVEEFDDFEDEEDEDEDVDIGSDYTDDENLSKTSARRARKNGKKSRSGAAQPKTGPKKSPAKATQLLDLSAGEKKARDGRGKKTPKHKSTRHIEVLDEDDDDGDFEMVNILHKAPAKQTSARKKASRKEGRTHVDVIDVDEDDEASDSRDGDFEISVAHQLTKKGRLSAPKAKSPKHAKAKLDYEGAPSKIKKTKIKQIQPSEGVQFVPASKLGKKKGPKRHNHDQTEVHGVKSDRRDAEPSSVQPLTLTPLSSIWTTREESSSSAESKEVPESGARLAYKLDLLWDETIFTDETPLSELNVEDADGGELSAGTPAGNNERGFGKRQVRSVQQSQIRQSMLAGNLDPHTMVQCEAYLPRGGGAIVEAGNSRSRGAAPQIEAPFEVAVHPDVTFVCDLHSHLATCEIIGFLGGRWDDATRTLFIQAAFPCRSLEIAGDDGSTDVEMDPGSEIELREIIQNAELEVVGWYHSHPAFAPDPSIRDIENQTSYQHLFQRSKLLESGKNEVSFPFVGLIVGTYDQRRESPVGLFRYFHTREERLNSGVRNLVHMPYELIPRKRHYRSVVEDARRDHKNRLPLYLSVASTLHGIDLSGFIRCPPFPTDKNVVQPNHDNRNASIGVRKKRKGPSDIVAETDEPRPVKKRAGWPKGKKRNSVTPKGATREAAAPEIIDLVTGGSQEPYHSQQQAAPTPPRDDRSILTKLTTEDHPNISSSQSETSGQECRARDASTSDSGCHSNRMPGTDALSDTTVEMAIVVDDSSQANTLERFGSDCCEVSQERGGNEESFKSMINRLESSSAVVDSSLSDDVVCDSSQSQDVAPANEGKSETPNYNMTAPSILSQQEYVVSSSLSQSESSELYDASQSQPSQPGDSIPSLACSAEEVDHFAGVDIITETEPSEPSSSQNDQSQNDRTMAIKNAETSAQYLDTAIVTSNSPPKPELRECDEVNGQSTAMQDEVVDDSGPDVAGLCNGRTGERDIVTVQQSSSPGEDDIVIAITAPPGGSSALLSGGGRRRTRKPVTVRRHSGSGTAPSPKAALSSPGVNAMAVDQSGEIAASLTDVKISPPEDQKMTSDSHWYGVEVIKADYLDGDEAKSLVKVSGAFASSSHPMNGVESTPDEVKSLGNICELDSLRNGVKSEGHPVVPVEDQTATAIDVDNESQDILVKREVKEDTSTPLTPQHGPLKSDGVADVKTEQNGSPLAAIEGGTGQRSRSNKPINTAGALVEPLDRKGSKDLKRAVDEMGLGSRLPKDRKGKKADYIRVIREYWIELRRGQPLPAGEEVLPNIESQPCELSKSSTAADEVVGVPILDEAREVVGSLIDAVESQFVLDTPSVAVISYPRPIESELQNIKTEMSSSKAVATESGLDFATKTEPGDAVEVCSDGAILDGALKPTTAAPLAQPSTKAEPRTREDRRGMHLDALRTKYGPGVYCCTEQVITLIDYYRDFRRRTDLYEVWRTKIRKVDKIEASLRADVEHVNLPVALREAFIQDVMGYLRTSWKVAKGSR